MMYFYPGNNERERFNASPEYREFIKELTGMEIEENGGTFPNDFEEVQVDGEQQEQIAQTWREQDLKKKYINI